MTAWGRVLTSAFNFNNESVETGLVRMFRIEYAKEYQNLKRMGCEINDKFVKQFLKDSKHSYTT